MRDSGFKRRGLHLGGRSALLAAGAAAGLLVGIGWHLYLGRDVPTAAPAAAAKPAATAAPVAPPTATAVIPVPAATPSSTSSSAVAPGPAAALPATAPALSASTAPAPPAPMAQASSAVQVVSAPGAQAAPAMALAPLGKHTPPVAGGRLSLERFAATQTWLAAAPAEHFSIQLATISQAEAADLERLLRQAAELLNPNELYVYGVRLNGQQYYRAAYGDFPSADAAGRAIEELPATLRSRRPYQRSVESMRAQNLQ